MPLAPRAFFSIALLMLLAAIGLHLRGVWHQRQVVPLVNQLMGVPDPERGLLDIEARRHAQQGNTYVYTGLACAAVGFVLALVVRWRRKQGPLWLPLGLATVYVVLLFAWT